MNLYYVEEEVVISETETIEENSAIYDSKSKALISIYETIEDLLEEYYDKSLIEDNGFDEIVVPETEYTYKLVYHIYEYELNRPLHYIQPYENTHTRN